MKPRRAFIALLASLLLAAPAPPAVGAAAARGERAGPRRLVAIGGGRRTPEIMSRVVRWSGGTGRARVCVIAWAWDDEAPAFNASVAYRNLAHELLRAGAAEAPRVPAPPERAPRDAEAWGAWERVALETLAGCGGVFFSGGGQSLAVERLRASPRVEAAIRDGYESGRIAIAGTSAGNHLMGRWMVVGERDRRSRSGRSEPLVLELRHGEPGSRFDRRVRWERVERARERIEPGAGYLGADDVILDTHVNRRPRRLYRMLWLLSARPETRAAILVDEATAIAVEDGVAEVLGKGRVRLLDARPVPGKVVSRWLRRGDRFALGDLGCGTALRTHAPAVSSVTSPGS